MRPILILFAAYLTMACTETLDTAYAVDGSIKQTIPHDRLAEPYKTQIDTYFAEAYADAQSFGMDTTDLLRIAQCDLNGDDADELVVMGASSLHCSNGAVVCGLWVFRQTAVGWDLILEGQGEPRIADSRTNGWADIVAEGGRVWPYVYKFDGTQYFDGENLTTN